MFKIGDFSKISQVSIRSLRHYDQIGLFRPAYIDKFTGYRFYTIDQLPRLNKILALKDLGLSLEEIGDLLDTDFSIASIRALLNRKQNEIRARITEEELRLRQVQQRLAYLEREGTLPQFDITLKEPPPQTVFSISAKLPNLNYMEPYFLCMEQVVREKDIDRTDHPMLAIYHYPVSDYPRQPRLTQMILPIDVAGHKTFDLGQWQMEQVRLPAHILMAVTVYRGNYGLGIRAAHLAIQAWIRDNGYQHAGAAREIFHRHEGIHWEADNLVEIQYPIVR